MGESILSLVGSNRARPCWVRSQWICIEALTEPAQLLLGPMPQSFCPRGSEIPVHSGQGQGDGKTPQVALSCDKDPSLLLWLQSDVKNSARNTIDRACASHSPEDTHRTRPRERPFAYCYFPCHTRVQV